MTRIPIVLLVVSFAACLPEVRVGENEGLKPIEGSTVIASTTFACGETVGAATSKKVEGGCEVRFSEDVQVIDEPDYAQNGQLASFSGLLEAVELELRAFSLVDATTGEPLVLETQVASAEISVNGQWVADKAALMALPKTFRLEGEAVEPMKAAISRREAVALRIDAVVVLPDAVPLPGGLALKYEAQPVLVLGGAL